MTNSDLTIPQQTVLLCKLHPMSIEKIAREAHIDRSFSSNWLRRGRGARIDRVEAVLNTCGYYLKITPLKSVRVSNVSQ